MRNGETVAAFERAFSEYVGAKYAIALCNGTATLHTALVALGVKPGDRVATTPLTMSATTLAILHAGAVPVYCDVDPKTWLMAPIAKDAHPNVTTFLPVSLYGLHHRFSDTSHIIGDPRHSVLNDAAQTLKPHYKQSFTSYSFQASKILSLGEGGMLVTNDESLATRAREFSSLGYRMRADQPRIDPAALKHPTYERHHSIGWNYRMSDLVAARGLAVMRSGIKGSGIGDFNEEDIEPNPTGLLWQRRTAASYYRDAISGCSWITTQYVPEGWSHDYWAYAIALKSKELFDPFVEAIVRHGGERPYGAWRLSYHEPALRYLIEGNAEAGLRVDAQQSGPLADALSLCPVVESLQPRLLQFQTNNLQSAQQNADAVAKAIKEIGG